MAVNVGQGANRYFNEFMFQRMYERINNDRLTHGKNVLTISEGRTLHKTFMDNASSSMPDNKKLPQGVYPMGYFNKTIMIGAVDAVLSEYSSDVVLDENLYNTEVAEFSSLTGLKGDVSQDLLPLSPFDEQFANQDEFVKNGSQMLYATAKDLDEYRTSDRSIPDFMNPSFSFYKRPSYDRDGYLNEFVFQRMYERVNNDRIARGEKVLTVSKGRALHQEFMDNAISFMPDDNKPPHGVYPMGYFDKSAMIKAAGAVFGNYSEDVALDDDLYDFETREFSSIVGITGSYNQDVMPLSPAIVSNGSDQGLLPLSPFDERFDNRATFRRNGSRMLYTKISDLDKYRTADNASLDFNNPELSVFRKFQQYDGSDKLSLVGRIYENDDASGMTALMPYMSQKEYNEVADWVNSVGSDNYMSHDAIGRTVAILQELQNDGLQYTIKKDSKVGQIKAVLSGTKVDVRLTDTRENERMVGRVFCNDSAIYYNTNKPKDGNRGATMGYDNPTSKESLNLLKFALGHTIDRSDLPGTPVGKMHTYTRMSNRGHVEVNGAYHSGNNYSAVIGSVDGDSNSQVLIHVEGPRTQPGRNFVEADQAEAYLREAVAGARDNFSNLADINGLLKEAKDHADDDEYAPDFSGDIRIATAQRHYWDFLAHGDPLDGDYDGSEEEQVRAHFAKYMNECIGTYDAVDGKRFDPKITAFYMPSVTSKFRNELNMVNALRRLDIPADELRGSDDYLKSFKDKLIKFDENSARPMNQISSHNDFVNHMFETIKTTINETGCSVNDDDILMDANGVVRYEATRARSMSIKGNKKSPYEKISGEIGQIFVPDERGLVETKFASSDNYLFSPGYEAHILPQKEGESKTVEERTRLKGYEQSMADGLRYQVRNSLMSSYPAVGDVTGVNSVYRRLYDTRYSLDFEKQAEANGMTADLVDDIIKTNALRVSYDKSIQEGSTINAEYQSSVNPLDATNDNFSDAYKLTGMRNMAIMTEHGDGYFDPSATSASVNQGIVRYLTQTAQVAPDGSIIKGDVEGPGSKTPLMNNEVCRYFDHIPFDRQQMTFTNLLRCNCVTKPTGTAQMTFGGWNFDDGYIVSKEFAETYTVDSGDDKRRALTIGDKLSDMNGNKGVISLVVDRNMDPVEAEAQGLGKALAWFKENPDLDVVGAPFPAMSRFNGGSARELMENPLDLKNPDGRLHDGCMGFTHYIVTDMHVDEKTHVYDEEAVLQGEGRKASAQLAWALDSKDATNVLKEYYNTNSGSTQNLREMLITMGLDIDEKGGLRSEYMPHEGESRHVFKMPPLDIITKTDVKTNIETERVDITGMKKKFSDVIAHQGGFLEVPFELDMPSGRKLDVIGNDDNGKPLYGLPIMSSHLRSGQEFSDGSTAVHDYTNQYTKIYEACLRYREAERDGNNLGMEDATAKAQIEYNTITGTLERRQFSGKHNIFRDSIMSNKLGNSATAVWTADPRLDIDQVAMSGKMMDALNLKELTPDELLEANKTGKGKGRDFKALGEGHVVLWRDPMLRDGGIKYLRVKRDDSLTGIAVNPVTDKPYDGDFDGDSVALNKLQSVSARKDAMLKLTWDASLLDHGSVDKTTGLPTLAIHNSLDLRTAAYENPELDRRRADITAKINDDEMAFNDGKISQVQLGKLRSENVKSLSEYVKDSFENEYGNDMVSFKDMPSHIASLEHMVQNGAKGNYNKLRDYSKYLGVDYDMTTDSDGKEQIDISSVKDLGVSQATREDSIDTQYATTVKSFGTGIAGMFSQRGISVLRNECPKAMLELTYPVTQSVLQAKHDPVEAKQKYDVLMGPARTLWKGFEMEPIRVASSNGEMLDTWKVVMGADNKPKRATPEMFRSQFMDIYTSKHGLNVSVNEAYVDEITEKLTGSDGRMLSVETFKGSENVSAKELKASPMDKLAYGGNFQTLVDLANNNANLFEGKYNQHFAPKSIRDNIQAEQDGKSLKAIVKSDTKEPKLQVLQNTVSVLDRDIAVDAPPKDNELYDDIDHTKD